MPFIGALDTGEAYRFGALDKANPGRFKGAGFYASGDNFVTWSADGAGHARLGGVWSQTDRSELSRRNNPDHTIDLRRDAQPAPTTLLHLDPNAPALRPHAQTGQQLDQPSVSDRRAASSDATEQPLYRDAESAVRRLDASLGREYDEASVCMAASLACLARNNGLDRIDQVLLSVSGDRVNVGENVFVVQGDPADPGRRMAHMKTQDAVSTPAEQSLAQLSSLAPPVPPQTMTASLEQAPELQGPRMRI